MALANHKMPLNLKSELGTTGYNQGNIKIEWERRLFLITS
jgi:hypothetical protein